MPKKIYDWKRLWYPPDGEVSLQDDGFLVDPASEIGKYHTTDVVPFESFEQEECLILLGEPGIGKSTALEAEFGKTRVTAHGNGDAALLFNLRDYASDTRLVSSIFECQAVRDWTKSNYRLHLFLDSLDEGLLRIDNISAILLSELRKLPVDRLSLRIAYRAAERQQTLEQELPSLWGDDSPSIYHAAPLTKSDVHRAARQSGINGDEFIKSTIDSRAVPFAIKPVTLKFLLRSFAKNGSLSKSKADLYREGCRVLCEETNESRRDSKNAGELTPTQRYGIAKRIAAATQFSNKAAVWIGLAAERPEEDLDIDLLSGGTEDGAIEVTRERLNEVLNTGVFSPRGPARLGWSHQTYGEFLAADAISSGKLTIERIRPLILHSDGSDKVVPQLREVAIWLALMDRDVLKTLAASNPEILMSRDVLETATDEERNNIALALLQAVENGATLPDWGSLGNYRWLRCSQLSNTVSPYISDRSRSHEARLTALHIARYTNLTEVQHSLAAIVLDPTEQIEIRIDAVRALAAVGNSEVKRNLLPLMSALPEEDNQDQLRGYTLNTLWPEHLSFVDLSPALTAPKRNTFLGAYYQFLHSGIVDKLTDSDIKPAIVWAGQHPGNPLSTDPLSRLASSIIDKGLDRFYDANISAELANALLHQWEFGESPIAKVRNSGGKRLAIARAMLPAAASHRHGTIALADICGITSDDVRWLLDEFRSASADEVRKILADLISRLLSPDDVDTFDAVLAVCRNDATLEAAMRPRVSPVELGSPEAIRQRELWEAYTLHRQPRADPVPQPPEDLIGVFLKSRDPGVFFSIWSTLEGVRPTGFPAPPAPIPHWERFDPAQKSQIVDAACEYVSGPRPPTGQSWLENGNFTYGVLAGYTALYLLEAQSPSRLGDASYDDWVFWIPVIISHPFQTDNNDPIRQKLLKRSYDISPDVFITALDTAIAGEIARSQRVFIPDKLGEFWNERIAEVLREKLRAVGKEPDGFRDLLAPLLDHDDVPAQQEALRCVTKPGTLGSPERAKSIRAALELVNRNSAVWQDIWSVIQSDEEYGLEIFRLLAGANHYGAPFIPELDEHAVADIYLWLADRNLHLEDETHGGFSGSMYMWCSMLINSLTGRGTVRACENLRRIIIAHPEMKGLPYSLKQAEELVRRNTWDPPEPNDVIRLLSDSTARLITNGEQLLGALLESLEKLQADLRDVTPAAPDLWNEMPTLRGATRIFRPKHETEISDYIKRYLQRDLTERSVILNREVQIQAPMGGNPGENTDIYVDIVPKNDSGLPERISAIVEVKCCWHRDFLTAMKEQLADRYLAHTSVKHGLYLAVWCNCGQWDRDDARHTRSQNLDRETVRRQLAELAADLSRQERKIHLFLLDVALP